MEQKQKKKGAATAEENSFSGKTNVWEESQNETPTFGWGRLRPAFLRFLSDPKWFLLVITLYTLGAGMSMNGLPVLTLPAIEKRFSFSSKMLGVISASNDITAMVLVVFIGYYGDYSNKIRWIGGGAAVAGLGLLLFVTPHFLIGPYDPPTFKSGSQGMCILGNRTAGAEAQQCSGKSESVWYYIVIFIVAQLIQGAGICTLYPLVPAYMDENVHPKQMPIYLGVWYCSTFIGPGLGILIRGKFLSFYVDINQPSGLNITPKDPRWIGAWWLGFLVIGIYFLLLSVVILGFPTKLLGTKEKREKQIQDVNSQTARSAREAKLKNVLPSLRDMLTNWVFLFNTIGATVELVYAFGFQPFLAKIVELKFGLDIVQLGYLLSLIITPSTLVGVLVGSGITRVFSLKSAVKKCALYMVFNRCLSLLGPFILLIPDCRNADIAGLSTTRPQSSNATRFQSSGDDLLKFACNIDCQCKLKQFSPVCGSDNITYFNPCHAGCQVDLPDKTFANCSCISQTLHSGNVEEAKSGYCNRGCKNLALFLALVGVIMLTDGSKVVPGQTVILRSVPENKLAFAFGIQYVCIKTLGLIPGPIIFGHIVDISCILWQRLCGKKGRCFDYDMDALSQNICIFGSTAFGVSVIFYFLSWYFCKPEINTATREVETQINYGAETDPEALNQETKF